MSHPKLLSSAMLAAFLVGATLSTAQVVVHPGVAAPSNPAHLEPCWQVAGVSKSAMQERRAIEQRGHQQIEAVCANSSLSLQQKRAQIKQIHQQEREQIEAIITPAQQEAIKACQQERGHSGQAHAGGGHGGPCGELSSAPKPNAPEDEPRPTETPHPN